MISTPLFRVGDVVTMRDDLRAHASIRNSMLFAYEDSTYRANMSADVLPTDIDSAGDRFVITVMTGHGTQCYAESDGYTLPDAMTVEAYKIMRYLNYN